MTTPHAPALRDDAPPAPRARRRAPLSLALAAALGATGLVPAAAAPAPERPAEDPVERRADAPTAPRATPSDEVRLGAPLAVVAAATGGTYTVRRGDTVSAIAARTGVSQRTIARANGLDAAGSIREGQVLRLTGTATRTPSSSAAPTSSGAGTYTVRPGDSLSTVAAREGTTVAALRQVNPGVGADGLIRVGQRLSVPGGTAAPAASSDPVASTFLGRSYPGATTQAATANRDALRARSVPGRDAMRALVRDTASRYGVDPSLAQAVAFQESGFDMRAVSPANAVGVMQVIPSSGEWAADLSGQSIDLLDPQDNVTAGVVILRQLLRSAPDTSTAIAGYYQGLGSVRSRGMFSDTRRYVANVQTLQAQYR